MTGARFHLPAAFNSLLTWPAAWIAGGIPFAEPAAAAGCRLARQAARLQRRFRGRLTLGHKNGEELPIAAQARIIVRRAAGILVIRTRSEEVRVRLSALELLRIHGAGLCM